MKNNTPSLVLDLLGLASGLVSAWLVACLWNSYWILWLPGLIFGISIATFFVVKDGLQRWTRALGFVLYSTLIWLFTFLVTYVGAVAASFAGIPSISGNCSITAPVIGCTPLTPSPLSIFFGGFLGALLISVAVSKLFFRIENKLVVSLVGGILGVIGYEVGSFAFGGAELQMFFNMPAIIVIWQTGIAMIFSVLLATAS